jgi:DNA adenine methylase
MKLGARSPLPSLTKSHGGKHYLKRWIIGLMSPGRVLVEPYAFGLNVLLNCPRHPAEHANDLNPEIAHLWQVVRDEPEELHRRLARAPYAEATFLEAGAGRWGRRRDPIDRAARFLIVNRMSRGGKGQTFGWSKRLRGGRPGDLNAWESMLSRLPWVARRLRGVVVTNRPALDVIRDLDGAGTVFYLDPPYLHETRSDRKAYGPFEMTPGQHEELLDLVRRVRGAVYLSGYPSSLYDDRLAGWSRATRAIKNHSGQGRVKQDRTEVVWANRPFAA